MSKYFFQASATIKFVLVQLVKENHIVEPRVRVKQIYKRIGQRVLIPGSH